MYQVPVRFSSESGSDRRGGLWLDSRFGKGRDGKVRPRARRSRRYLFYAGLLVGFCVLLAFVGCGAQAGSGQLVAALSGVNFGAVTVGHSTTSTASFTNTGTGAVEISSVNIAGGSFKLAAGESFPITVAAKATYSIQIEFSPSVVGQASGIITVMSNAAAAPPTVNLTGLGVSAPAPAGVLSGITCNTSSMVGSGTDNCFVALSGPAASGGLTVNLASSINAVTVPASVTVPANTNGAGFVAQVAAVSAAQSAVLTATAGGQSESFALQLNAALRILTASQASVSFGTVAINSTATQSVVLTSSGTQAVTIQSASLRGTGYGISGVTLPVVLSPGQAVVMTIQFSPSASGNTNGKLTLTTNGSSGKTVAISLSGSGAGTSGGGGTGGGSGTPLPASLSCSSATMTGSGVDACNVTLSAAATAGGVVVNLASNNAALMVPASVTVPSGGISAGFTATAAAVSSAQTATLTATANGTSQTFAVQLNAAGAFLSASQTSVSFGNVSLNSLGQQTLILASTGTQPVTVSAAVLTGSGFSMSGAAFPVTLNPGQSVTLALEFIPTLAGAASGQITITSNATSGGTLVIPLSGTGAVPYEVNLTWDAPASSADAVAGYNVYRSLSGTSSYQLLNTAVTAATSFTDTTVDNGQSYVYYVTSVDSSGVESTPSNAFDVTIP